MPTSTPLKTSRRTTSAPRSRPTSGASSTSPGPPCPSSASSLAATSCRSPRSAGATRPPGLGPYQTAKWAVEGFSGVLHKELAPLGIHVTLIEPGGVRTEWAGASMQVADIRSVYRPTVGLIAEYAASGTPRSDPVKTAQAILQITQVDDPPLRLLLGPDAFTIARAADETKIASDERWKELTLSTEADDVGREDETRADIPARAPAVTPTATSAPLIS